MFDASSTIFSLIIFVNIPGTLVFAYYTSARRWYAPRDLAKVNNSEIERVTEMGKKLILLCFHSKKLNC